MYLTMLKGKIHRATVVQAELDYVGSITVDEDLLDAAGILEYQQVQIVDINNGSRFETYTIAGDRGSGMICLNGAAARCVQKGWPVTKNTGGQPNRKDRRTVFHSRTGAVVSPVLRLFKILLTGRSRVG